MAPFFTIRNRHLLYTKFTTWKGVLDWLWTPRFFLLNAAAKDAASGAQSNWKGPYQWMKMMDHWDHYRWSWVSGGWLKKEAHGGRGNNVELKIRIDLDLASSEIFDVHIISVLLRWFVLFFWLDKESTNQNRSLWIYNKFFENQLWDYLVREASPFSGHESLATFFQPVR